MTQHDFCMWLNGYIELGGSQPTQDQWEMIKEHLVLVFNKTTRSIEEIKTDRIAESDRKRDQQLKWFEDLQKSGDYVPPREVKPVDGPTVVEQTPWIIPDLPRQVLPEPLTWTTPLNPRLDPKPFDLSKLQITC